MVVGAQEDPGDGDVWSDDAWDDVAQSSRWSGFVEAGFGTRLDRDPLVSNRTTLEELRGRIESDWAPGRFAIKLRADGGYDGIDNDWFADVRDLTLSFTLGSDIDVKAGRQVQTWGTGDLVFLNDLFPKDFVSFFAGRDDEYLKAPSNALRISRFSSAVNIDVVWVPVFEPDNYLTGERFAFFSPAAGTTVAPDPPLSGVEPKESFSNGEFALRLYRTVEGREYALYAYRGFFKQPTALTASLEPTFAPLHAFGASLRRPAGIGLFNAEVSYYDSRDDRSGTDPRVPNDQFRALAGYEWEARTNFTVGLQYYLEWTLDHDALVANSPWPQYEPDEYRHLVTNRMTYRTDRDRFVWSWFTFLSPSDRDVHIRASLTYRYSDRWSLTGGVNGFGGRDAHTFFGQLEDASNAYLRVRYNR